MARLKLSILVLAVAALVGCEEYVQPPDVDLDFPPEGTFIEGDDLALSFTEPIDPDSLAVSIWSDTRDVENELPDGLEPLLEACTVAMSPCDEQGSSLIVSEDGLSAVLILDPAGIGKPDVPLLVEVLPGLRSDETGAKLGRNRIFDFQYKPAQIQEDPVPFDEGIYLFVSVFDQPIPNVITLMSDVKVTDDGRIYIVGAEADEIEGAVQSTRDPAELFIDETEAGFVIFAQGRIRENDRGERFVETETFTVQLKIGPLTIEIFGLRFTGIVVKNPDTDIDRISGTLSFEGISLTSDGGTPFIYDAGTTTFIADFVPEELIPPGTPDICEAPCGSTTSQCNVPEPWPPEGCCDRVGDGSAEGSGA